MRRIGLVMVLALPLAACQTDGSGQQNTLVFGGLGAAGGATAGALIARQNPVVGGLIGGVLGGAAGALIGRQLDADSERRRQEAIARAAETPERPTQWTGKDAGTGGQVRFRQRPRPTNTGRVCGTVQETITIGGQPQQADRETCRNPDGTWT